MITGEEIDKMQNAIKSATNLLNAQQETIVKYEQLSKAHDWALKALSNTLHSVCGTCAEVARITDDPEVQAKMWEIVQEVEKLQAEATEAMKMIEDI